MAGSWNEAACPTGTSAAGPMAVPEGTLPVLGTDERLGPAVAVRTGAAGEGRLDGLALPAVPPASLPTTLQLEVGILEPEAFQQLRALPANSAVQKTFLGKAGGRIQIYRQNIPVAGATR